MILISLVFFSCSSVLEREDYVNFILNPDNGLIKKQTVENIEISVMYEPTDFIIQREFDLLDDETLISERKKELEDYLHFQFRLKLEKGGNILAFNQDEKYNESTRVSHFSFNSKNDFKIVSEMDTVACQIAHYSRNYNLSPTIDLSIVFDRLPTDQDWQFIYKDAQYGIGTTKFLFSKSDLQTIPTLKL